MKVEKMTHTCLWVPVMWWDVEPGAYQVRIAPDAAGLYRVGFSPTPNELGVTRMFSADSWCEQPMTYMLYMKPGDVFDRVLVAGTTGRLMVYRLDAPDDYGLHYDPLYGLSSDPLSSGAAQ